MTTFVCRICLSVNVRMLYIEDSQLKELYEILTCSKLDTEDGRPKTMCFICVSQLQRCRSFTNMARQSETTLTRLLHRGIEITPNKVTALNLGQTHHLTVSDVKHTEIDPTVEQTWLVTVKQEQVAVEETPVTVKQENVVVKEEPPEDEDSNDFKDTYDVDFTRPFQNIEQPLKNEKHTEFNNKISLFNCDTCKGKFTTKGSLRTHLRIHSGEKPYTCKECRKAFRHAGNLKQHMLIHTGEKPYACNQCNRMFSKSYNLKQHMLTHTEEKPHACNECGKAFFNPFNLKQHKMIHSGEKPYACNECSKAFNRAPHLKRHMKIHKGEQS